MQDGTEYEYPWKDNKLNEYGEWEDDSEVTLADRFGNLHFWTILIIDYFN